MALVASTDGNSISAVMAICRDLKGRCYELFNWGLVITEDVTIDITAVNRLLLCERPLLSRWLWQPPQQTSASLYAPASRTQHTCRLVWYFAFFVLRIAKRALLLWRIRVFIKRSVPQICRVRIETRVGYVIWRVPTTVV